MNKTQLLYGIMEGVRSIADAINNLSSVIDTTPATVVYYDRVVWLDETGEYVLIWYADGTGCVLHNEGFVTTLSTVAQEGKTLYKLNNGKEMLFDRRAMHTKE